MGLFGAHAFSPQAFENASSILNGGGGGEESPEERLKKLLAQIHGGGQQDPYGVGPINVTPQSRNGGLMNYFNPTGM